MPVSQRKLLANRRNALRSTGPRTPSGKAVAARNAITHGLLSRRVVMPTEDYDEFAAFSTTLLDELAPVGPTESFMATRIVASAWRLRRVVAGPRQRPEAGGAEQQRRVASQPAVAPEADHREGEAQ